MQRLYHFYKKKQLGLRSIYRPICRKNDPINGAKSLACRPKRRRREGWSSFRGCSPAVGTVAKRDWLTIRRVSLRRLYASCETWLLCEPTGSHNFNADQKLWPHKWGQICGRSGGVRTHDLYVPNVALYQAELHSDNTNKK